MLSPIWYNTSQQNERGDNGIGKGNHTKTMNDKRIVFLDWMRVAACFMVMTIHSAEPFYLGGEVPNITSIASRWDMLWITLTECLCRVCVPLFVMTSSYLLFPVRRPTGEFFRRRLVRVVLPFVVWAAAYVWAAGGEWGRLVFNFPDEGGHVFSLPSRKAVAGEKRSFIGASLREGVSLQLFFYPLLLLLRYHILLSL